MIELNVNDSFSLSDCSLVTSEDIDLKNPSTLDSKSLLASSENETEYEILPFEIENLEITSDPDNYSYDVFKSKLKAKVRSMGENITQVTRNLRIRFNLFAKRRPKKRCLNKEDFISYVYSIVTGYQTQSNKLFIELATKRKDNKQVVFFRSICKFLAKDFSELWKLSKLLRKTIDTKRINENERYSALTKRYLVSKGIKPLRNIFQTLQQLINLLELNLILFPQELMFLNHLLETGCSLKFTKFRLKDVRVEADSFVFNKMTNFKMIYPLRRRSIWVSNRVFVQKCQRSISDINSSGFITEIKFSSLLNDSNLVKRGFTRNSSLSCFRSRYIVLPKYIYFKQEDNGSECDYVKDLYIEEESYRFSSFKHFLPCSDVRCIFSELGYPKVFAIYSFSKHSDKDKYTVKHDVGVIVQRLRKCYRERCTVYIDSQLEKFFESSKTIDHVNIDDFKSIVSWLKPEIPLTDNTMKIILTLHKFNLNKLFGFNLGTINAVILYFLESIAKHSKQCSLESCIAFLESTLKDTQKSLEEFALLLGCKITAYETQNLVNRFNSCFISREFVDNFIKVSRVAVDLISTSCFSMLASGKNDIQKLPSGFEAFVCNQLNKRYAFDMSSDIAFVSYFNAKTSVLEKNKLIILWKDKFISYHRDTELLACFKSRAMIFTNGEIKAMNTLSKEDSDKLLQSDLISKNKKECGFDSFRFLLWFRQCERLLLFQSKYTPCTHFNDFQNYVKTVLNIDIETLNQHKRNIGLSNNSLHSFLSVENIEIIPVAFVLYKKLIEQVAKPLLGYEQFMNYLRKFQIYVSGEHSKQVFCRLDFNCAFKIGKNDFLRYFEEPEGLSFLDQLFEIYYYSRFQSLKNERDRFDKKKYSAHFNRIDKVAVTPHEKCALLDCITEFSMENTQKFSFCFSNLKFWAKMRCEIRKINHSNSTLSSSTSKKRASSRRLELNKLVKDSSNSITETSSNLKAKDTIGVLFRSIPKAESGEEEVLHNVSSSTISETENTEQLNLTYQSTGENDKELELNRLLKKYSKF